MPLESTAAFLSDLDANSPAGEEYGSKLDDYIRTFKRIMLNQFPNFTSAAVTATVGEMNQLSGVNGGVVGKALANAVNGYAALSAAREIDPTVLPALLPGSVENLNGYHETAFLRLDTTRAILADQILKGTAQLLGQAAEEDPANLIAGNQDVILLGNLTALTYLYTALAAGLRVVTPDGPELGYAIFHEGFPPTPAQVDAIPEGTITVSADQPSGTAPPNGIWLVVV